MPPAHVHARALVESEAIGDGTVIHAFAHVMAGAVIGRNCKLGDHVFIESGVTIGDNVTIKNGVSIWEHVTIGDGVFLGPGVVLTNDRYPRRDEPWTALPTQIEDGVSVGANATILCGIRLGRRAVVAAGAVVTRSVDPHVIVSGNPARPRGWACFCGRPLVQSALTMSCDHCRRQYELVGGTLQDI